MSVHHDKAVIGIVEQEWFTDPAKIGLALLVDFDARTNSGMDEEIIAEPAAVVEALDELDMLSWNDLADELEHILIAHPDELVGVEAVAFQAFVAAEPAPLRNEIGFSGKDPKQNLLMVAEEENRSNPRMAVGPKPLHDLRRIGSTVDKVADEDDKNLAGLAAGNVAFNLPEKLFEKIKTAVNVPHDIASPSARAGAVALPSRSKVEHLAP